jgi:hypothetical protein
MAVDERFESGAVKKTQAGGLTFASFNPFCSLMRAFA